MKIVTHFFPLKRLLINVFCVALALSGYAQEIKLPQKADPNFHLYLLVGQSNMAGRGLVDSLSKQVNPQILMLNKSGEWVPATDPLHFDRPPIVGVGPGLNFATQMLGKNKKIKIGLIPCAVGGSPIKAWKAGEEFLKDHPYDDALKRAKIAMQYGVIKGIIWHQGESDSNVEKSKLYLGLLKNLIADLRKDLGAADLPFVAGELGYYKENYKLINHVLKDLPAEVPYTGVATAEGLVHKGDGTHLDTPSARELGKRFAQAMLKIQKKKSK
uniref:sialate O-acetylesterase n=1 Tax=Pedobacter schmidteae TaxID=2201271 RepID=UPI000EB29B95|nr:sialate O-acetylesterase [Pedobacter schmidteae]